MTGAIDRALEAIGGQGGEAARRAAAALDRCLASVRASAWPEVAWRFSRLTPSRFPLEIACGTAGGELRWTAEVAGPEVPSTERLLLAEKLLTDLSRGAALPTALREQLARLQAAPLRWGAWLGGRHSAQSDRFKLYAEVPRGAVLEAGDAGETLAGADAGALSLHRRCEMLMIGHEPRRARSEIYFRTAGFEPGELAWLLARAGQAGREGELTNLVEQVWGRPPLFDVPPLGFSISRSRGELDSFTLFKPARALCSDDRVLRRRLLALAGRRRFDFDVYQRLTHSIESEAVRGAHGLVAFVLPMGKPAGLSVGLDPQALFVKAPRPEIS